MVSWPAIVKYSGNNELLFVKDESAWVTDQDLQRTQFSLGDELIDSTGTVYELSVAKKLDEIPTKQSISLEAITELVRLHASELGNCCISKMIFPSVSDAVIGVSSIKDEH